MPVEEIELGPTWDGGLDFGEYFAEEGLVASALLHLIAPLPPTVGYCLVFHDIPNTEDSWFGPYADHGLVTHPTTFSQQDLPQRLKYKQLLLDTGKWPVLGRSRPNTPTSTCPDARWSVEVRLKDGTGKYVGYFMIAENRADHDSEPITDESFRLAYMATKLWLDQTVDERRRSAPGLQPTRQEHWKTTRERIHHDIVRGRPRQAARQVAMLLTSHFGARFNRAALFVPANSHTLTCVHAHGGDGSDEWTRVQRLVSSSTRSADEFHNRFCNDDLHSDPLFRDLVGETLSAQSASILNVVWRAGATLRGFPQDETIQPDAGVTIRPNGIQYPSRQPGPIAACLTAGDGLLTQHRLRYPNSAFLKAKSLQWYLLPWKTSVRPVGLVLVDLANWSNWDLTHDLLPRLRDAEELLAHFASDFAAVSW